MKRNYRGHAASLWLNLVPGLETSGSWDSQAQGPHGMLEGATWGLVRNRTTFPGVQQISLNDKVGPCLPGQQIWLMSQICYMATLC